MQRPGGGKGDAWPWSGPAFIRSNEEGLGGVLPALAVSGEQGLLRFEIVS